MSADITKSVEVVGGLSVKIYQGPQKHQHRAVLFLLHGRCGSTSDAEIEHLAQSMVIATLQSSAIQRDLLVITFDHRNHGTRLVDAHANLTWLEGNAERHAFDMYSIQVGSARDVVFLMDFLPAFIDPMRERPITRWGITGISLGGHSTWIALSQDPRLRVGIPIIGCPDYLALMKYRAKTSNIPFEKPYIPEGLLELMTRLDPPSTAFMATDSSNPFWSKRVLVLSGADDQLVPWIASENFVEKLEVGPEGVKKVIVWKGVGHECTEEMVSEIGKFVVEEMLR